MVRGRDMDADPGMGRLTLDTAGRVVFMVR